jgi:protein involved in polysaccharide export with SLBB domain
MRPDPEGRKEKSLKPVINAIFVKLSITILILNAFGSAYSQEARVHYGDVIDVDFVGGFEFDWRGGLTPEGYLDGLDAIDGPIYGLCLTEAEIATAVRKIYSKILRDPEVVVKIVDKSNRALARLNGAVKSSARFKLMRAVTLRVLFVF